MKSAFELIYFIQNDFVTTSLTTHGDPQKETF